MGTEGSNYKFSVNIDGKTFEILDSKDKEYQEVHNSCLSKKIKNKKLIFYNFLNKK